jgi:hypothetical protein
MNMASQDNRKATRDISGSDHVGSPAEGVIGWAHCGTFDTLVDTQHMAISVLVLPVRLAQKAGEIVANILSDVRKPGEGNCAVLLLEPEGPWTVEDEHPGGLSQQTTGYF